ncbi:PREDICTED: uncharacterized protein LOC109480248 [Branchiostoma belcheri]|uniref:Uncharacterized protein LOC109480248 n=1 Tax=Branchiostoma belcheri TaxID=7741 RepID=A0A6P5A881_BRABE|nr:PREDICTED: uncharacterized protein LOC109480248 [Branchiostoma belcheri]
MWKLAALPIPQKIQFHGQPANRLIENPFPTYKGTLVQKTRQNGDPKAKVFRAAHVPAGNRDSTVLVYSYTSTPPVTGGTYVVLQFKESGLYFASKGRSWYPRLVLQEGEDATKITSTADPRVFLMKPTQNSAKDFVFASCVASKQKPDDPSKARVITLSRNKDKPAVLKLEEKGPSLESQYFKKKVARGRSRRGEQSDECQVQEEQHRN